MSDFGFGISFGFRLTPFSPLLRPHFVAAPPERLRPPAHPSAPKPGGDSPAGRSKVVGGTEWFVSPGQGRAPANGQGSAPAQRARPRSVRPSASATTIADRATKSGARTASSANSRPGLSRILQPFS